MTMIRDLLLKEIHELQNDYQREYSEKATLLKKNVLDTAFKKIEIRKIAELGCVWGVNGFYGRYMAQKHSPDQVTMVDAIWNEEAKKLCSCHGNIKMVDGDFTDLRMPETIGKVDAVVFFDILLHLVSPDWNYVLEMYAPFTRSFLVVNPQFTGCRNSVRLLDLGNEEYFKNIPHSIEYPIYKRVFENPYQIDSYSKKPLRDTFYIWQWGITNHGLIDVMEQLGYELWYLERDKLVYGKERNFINHAFIFVKD